MVTRFFKLLTVSPRMNILLICGFLYACQGEEAPSTQRQTNTQDKGSRTRLKTNKSNANTTSAPIIQNIPGELQIEGGPKTYSISHVTFAAQANLALTNDGSADSEGGGSTNSVSLASGASSPQTTSNSSAPVIDTSHVANAGKFGIVLKPAEMNADGPGIIAIHGSSGMSTGFQALLVYFVARNFRVLLIDLFGKVPTSSTEAKSLEAELLRKPIPEVKAQITTAAKYFVTNFGATKYTLMGFGSGGRWASQLGVIDDQTLISGLVSFYGDPTYVREGHLQVPMFGIFAQNDTNIKANDVLQLSKEMSKPGGLEFNLKIYPNVNPGFVEPYRNIDYNAQESRRALGEVFDFLSRTQFH